MGLKKKLALVFFSVHILLIGLSSAEISLGTFVPVPIVNRLANLYAYVTGVGYHYGFFAPGVSSQMRVDYRCFAGGREIAGGEFQSGNPESTFRIHNIMESFWEVIEQPEARRALAASFAAQAFKKCQKVDEVEILAKTFVLPSMQQFREGKKAGWEHFYRTKFKRAVQ